MPQRIIIVGPGRAGMSLGIALRDAGHDIVGVLGRSTAVEKAAVLDTMPLAWDEALPEADLLIVAVRDDAIQSVAERLSPFVAAVGGAVHLSGLKPVDALGSLAERGIPIGGFHPLQTLPNPEDGARALEGAWVGVAAFDAGLRNLIEDIARDLRMIPFPLDDSVRSVYHAAAAAGANYVLAALDLSARLFHAAGVSFDAARPLVESVVANAFNLGPGAALTGPIARGDVETVRAQVEAVRVAAPELAEAFIALGRVTAGVAETEAIVEDALR